MADISEFEKPDVLNWWKTQSFDLQIDEHLGNCVFCIKKSELKIALAARDEPKMAKNFIQLLDTVDIRPTRNDPRMYWGKQTLQDIINSFADKNTEDLRISMRGGRRMMRGHAQNPVSHLFTTAILKCWMLIPWIKSKGAR